MGKNIARIVLALTVLSATGSVAQKSGTNVASQICADQPLPKTAAIPVKVLEMLTNRPEVRDAIEGFDKPETLFRATEIDISSGDADLLIIGTAPASGADNNWFWIVRHPRAAPQIILFAGASCLDILRSRTSGYHDVLIVLATPGEIIRTVYKFDGGQYRESSKSSEPNNL